MNSKNLLLIVTILLLVNIAFFALKGNPTISSPQGSQNTFTLPVSTNHKGVSSATLLYNFTGKVVRVEPIGQDTRLVLDISDSQTPNFLVKNNATVFAADESSPKTPVKINADSIKIGSSVNIGMIYNILNKTWSVAGVSVTPSSPPSLLPSSTPPPLKK